MEMASKEKPDEWKQVVRFVLIGICVLCLLHAVVTFYLWSVMPHRVCETHYETEKIVLDWRENWQYPIDAELLCEEGVTFVKSSEHIHIYPCGDHGCDGIGKTCLIKVKVENCWIE